jgi:ATP-dependent DNA ligase
MPWRGWRATGSCAIWRRSPEPFPVFEPILPMLAKVATSLPEGAEFLFEPKWDGFRAIVFRQKGVS